MYVNLLCYKIDFFFKIIYNVGMENKEIATEQNIDYNVFNALNLYNEELGESYLETGFNPFDQNFVLDENFITDMLTNNQNKKDVAMPEFLEKSQIDIKKSFNLSLENATQLLNSLSTQANSENLSPKQKMALQKLIYILKMYIELIKKYIKKLKKEKNKYQMFINLLALNWQLSENMALSFTSEFNLSKTLYNIEMQQSKIAQQENEQLKAQARQIIENNLKKQQELSKPIEKPMSEPTKTEPAKRVVKQKPLQTQQKNNTELYR